MPFSRREFIASSLALPALRLSSARTDETSPRHSSFDPWIEVHQENLRANITQIHARVGGRPILAVIKNNGYGLGSVNVARILDPLEQVSGLAVIKLNEAIGLREAKIRKPILLMGPFDEKELREVVARDITPMVYTPMGATLDELSRRMGHAIHIHVCIDTGIGRVGVPHREAATLIRDLARRSSVRIDGVMMTFTEDPEFDEVQLQRFLTLCDGLKKEGISLGRRHAASSFGLFQNPDGFLDMVRPGMVLFGIYPENEFRTLGAMDLRPAVALRARVIYVKKLEKGESAGYNRVFKPAEDTWVATIPVGHADGYPRAAVKGANVRIGAKLYRVMAVSASHTIVEIGKECPVNVGDVVSLFDWEEGLRPEDVASACGGSVYDLTMHLNALLPRVIL